VTARGTDWGLAALVALLMVTGALTLFAGSSADEWVFVAHDALGFAIVLLLAFKLRRVWPRLRQPRGWDGTTMAGVLGTALVVAALGSGLLWSDGATPHPGGYSLLAWHDALGAVLAVAIACHMVFRAKRLRARDVAHRRQFLTGVVIGAGGLLLARGQRPVQRLLGLPGASRRFTGSYEANSFAGNAFPTTSWVADNPRPIALESYRLRVGGLVTRQLAFSLEQLRPVDELTATLDCTGGFYSTQRWGGVRLMRLLDQVGVRPRAGHVSIVSRTGYRWSFALGDADQLLLATYVGDQPLSHEHGAPVRLVAPSSRGFQWVKWVDRIDVRELPDYTAPASTVWSSFTAAGQGDG
jgi:DMSO/TMAO reductase YedYZ molybdopterin-dependent catalytic subunit